MIMDESIAYEIAMLVRENRKLREQVEELKLQNESLVQDYNRLFEVRNKQKKKDYLDAEYSEEKDLYVYITETQCEKPKYDIGFIICVESMSKGEDGLITLYGECLERDDINHTPSIHSKVKINNKSYAWKIANVKSFSTLVKVEGACRNKSSFLVRNDRDQLVSGHYESENLITFEPR